MKIFDRVCVSCDDSHFKDFLPLVSMAWKKFFPEVKVTCGFVTDKEETHPELIEMRKYAEIKIYKPIKNVPLPSQGKMTRLIMASDFTNDICLIDDIDSIPLQSSYINNIIDEKTLKLIEDDYLMALAADAYKNTQDQGKFPMGYLTAKGSVFKKIINPESKNLDSLYEEWKKNYIDGKESVLNTPIEKFSDESLVRYLLTKNPVKIIHKNRNCDIYNYWIDRSWWNIDINRLNSQDYVMCNFLRPLEDNLPITQPIIDFLKK